MKSMINRHSTNPAQHENTNRIHLDEEVDVMHSDEIASFGTRISLVEGGDIESNSTSDCRSESDPLLPSSSSQLRASLKPRHVEMIAVGGTIGTGLFLSSGYALYEAGPVGSLVSFSLVGLLVFLVMTSLTELAAHRPVPGAFVGYALLYVDPSLSFALAVNYWLQWAISLPSEISAAGMVISYWVPHIPSWIWSGLILGILTCIQILGVGAFGEIEYWLSIVKVIAIIAFLIAGFLIDLGWSASSITSHGQFIGFQNWFIEGAPFKNGIMGLSQVFLVAFFSFGGTELVGVAAAETQNPSTSLPKAVKRTFWRIVGLYIMTMFIMGLVIRNDNPNLLNGSHSSTSNSIAFSPFTMVFEMLGIPGAKHVMNTVVLFAILSASNSAMYAATRSLMAMGQQGGTGPRVLGSLSKKRGVPYVALALTVCFGSLVFLSIFWGDGFLFTLLLNVTGISGLLTWMSICYIHYRFRQAMTLQKLDPDEILPYKTPFIPHPYGAIICFGLGTIVLACQVSSLFLNTTNGTKDDTASSIISTYASLAGIPLFFGTYLTHKYLYNTRLIPLEDIQVVPSSQ